MGVWPNVIKACRITMGTRVNLTYPVFMLEAAESGRGIEKHATYSIALESSANTGSFLLDVKGWEVVRETPTKLQCHRK